MDDMVPTTAHMLVREPFEGFHPGEVIAMGVALSAAETAKCVAVYPPDYLPPAEER